MKFQIFKLKFVLTIIATKWLKVVDSSLNSLEDRILYMIGGISIGRLYRVNDHFIMILLQVEGGGAAMIT